MSFFKKNANEAAFVEGKKHWIDVIKNSGPEDVLIWRQPEEDFNTNSTLIVLPGEEAIFVKGGTIQQVFDNGTYKLSTNNYPFISRLATAFSGGISTFNCVVYYVRKTISPEMLWGTSSRIQVRDRVWGVRTDFGARGAFSMEIDNSGVFLEKVVGNNKLSQSADEVYNYFGNQIKEKIISSISAFLNSWPSELIGLESQIQQISQVIRPQIDDTLRPLGLKCASFSISGLEIDTSKYDQMDEAQIQKMKLQTLGDKWAALTAADILKTLAQNPGAGGMASAGAGLGMGVAAGGVFGSLAQQMFSAFPNGSQNNSGSNQTPGAFSGPSPFDFEPAVDSSPTPAPAGDDPMAVLGKLKQLLDAGLISQAAYDEKVKEVLSRM